MALLTAIVRWSLGHRAVVLVLLVVFVLVGLRSASSLKLDAVPDVTSVQVQIITGAPALAPVEVESYVTIPVERVMAGLPGSIEVRSLSKYGISLVTVVFEDATDIVLARQLVAERMPRAVDAVPARYGRPVMGPMTSGLGEIFQFAITNEKLGLKDTTALLEWSIIPQLRTVPGVVEVNAFGGQRKEYEVIVDPSRLKAASLSIDDVADAIRNNNANAGGGYVEHAREHLVVGLDGLLRGPKDLADVVVRRTENGVPLTVGSVAEIRIGHSLRVGAASVDDRGEAVVGVVLMQTGENALAVTERVKKKLDELGPSLPQGTKIEPFYDRSKLVRRTTRTVGENLLEGAGLVIVVLLVLLGDLRAGLVVALTIPLSLLFAVAIMGATGMSGNLMSLGAIDFGLIVDGAVIVVENASRHLAEAQRKQAAPLDGETRVRVVEEATLEVRAASVFGEAIIAIVYLPILSLTSIEGKLFRPMATTVLLALGGAFLLTLTVIPVLASLVIKPRTDHRDTWLIRKAHAIYEPVLAAAARHRAIVIGSSVALLAGALLMFTRVGAEFVPQLDEGEILVEARRFPDAALSESIATDARMQRALLKIPEVRHVVSKTGAPALATDPMGLSQTDVYIELADRSEWRRGLSKEALANDVAKALDEHVPEVAAGISQPIEMRTNELVAGIRSDVAALLYGEDNEVLAALGHKLAAKLRTIPGAVDVRVEDVAGLRYLRVIPDRQKLARHGVSIEALAAVVEAISVGHPAGQMFEGERRFGIVVKTDAHFAGDTSAVAGLPVATSRGTLVPVGEVADVVLQEGPAEINREAQSRRLLVELNVRGRDVLGVVEDARRAAAKIDLPKGYRVTWGGEFEHYVDARERLAIVVPLALGLILFVLWLGVGSLRTALLVYATVPFALIGGVFALAIRGIPFSVSAAVGFIALFGVAVLNGLVMVSFSKHLEERGETPERAIHTAAGLRLRPVLMTALVAMLGFVPMAVSTAPGSEVQRPLATVVIGGLVSAVILTLVALPALYARFAPRPTS
ncbi:MAG: efflux RND transporter permease subunit [Labilithrix sp.]|nr:efflux RND transporter permease subunit [Labilithrix sp.]MCW5811636.1 efflux RND transporter permease subunit [Labilithrix sp.]